MLTEQNTGSPAARIIGDHHQLENHEHPRVTPRGEHKHHERGQERHIRRRERRRDDITHPRFLTPIQQTPRSAHEHRDVESEEHSLAAEPPRARHHADRTHVQRCHSQGDAHARKRTSQLPNAHQTHERNDTYECGQRRKQGNRDSGDQNDRRRDCLRKITTRLPRGPTRGMIIARGTRGKDTSQQ